eukprot:5410312-Alexandrium_andersonii.AAC.1
MVQSAPSGASGANFEAALGVAQFQLRTLEAMLRAPQDGLRLEANGRFDGPLHCQEASLDWSSNSRWRG